MTDSSIRVVRVQPQRLHELRRRVLRGDDLTADVVDARDEESTSLHFGGFVDDRLVVSASFYLAAPPFDSRLVSYQLRYMATDFDVQGRGHGAAVLSSAEGELRLQGVEQLWANGRDSALAFYRALGWSIIEGSEHISVVTNLAHTVIVKRLVDDRPVYEHGVDVQ